MSFEHQASSVAAARRPPAGDGETDCANSIFQQPWWLEAEAAGRWGEVTVTTGERTVARMPYVIRKRGGMVIITQPPIAQTLGPWVEPTTAKPTQALAREMELLEELEGRLPRADAFRQQFSPTMLNAMPFHWAGYHLELRYTYRLEDLGSEERLWEGLRSHIRRDIRKARERVEIRDDLGLDRFYDVWAKTFERQGMRPNRSFAQLERIEQACASRGARAMLVAQDEAKRIHAVAYVVWDRRTAYYLFQGGDPELRSSGATSLLTWDAIGRARAVADVFDFEGSMMRPIERFLRAFGGRQTPYLRVTRASRRARVAAVAQSSAAALASWARAARSSREP